MYECNYVSKRVYTPHTNPLPPHTHRSQTLRPGLPPSFELPDIPPHFTPPGTRRPLPTLAKPSLAPKPSLAIPPTEDSETDYSDMEEEDQLKITQKQNGSDKELPIKTSSGSSTPIVGENRVHAVATNGSPAPNRAYTNQNGTQNTGMESPIIPKPKSSGSGAIAQHLKHILNKKSSEKETMKTSPKESSSTESGESTPVSKSAPNTDDFVVVEGRSSIRSNVSSISETSTGTDIESSIDTSTPLVSPTSSLSTNKMVKNPLAQLRLNNDEDVIQCRGYTMRSRTHTLAALRYKGKKPIERGRQRLTDIKKEEKKGQPKIKRQSSLTNLNTIGVDYELISPEIACWIRGKIIRDLENKYGGSEKANKAASKIQRMYREYKLQSRFKEIRREKHRRNRAHSMRTPGRRPSILNKKRPKYRRETSTPSVTDPLLKAREASKLLSKERTGHTHSGTRLELVQEKRQKVVELVEVTLEEELEVCNVGVFILFLCWWNCYTCMYMYMCMCKVYVSHEAHVHVACYCKGCPL